jgi:NitT/TauT family transport system substrate-binding protein
MRWSDGSAGSTRSSDSEQERTEELTMRTTKALLYAAALAAAAFAQMPQALAQDKLKLAIGQRGNWDTAISHVGEKAGIFKKHGIELEMTYTSGSGETLQPVISNSVDIGLAIGTMGALSAYAKGAPVRVIGAEATGAADYWYAKADSGIKTLKDTNGKTIAFSSRGSSTNSIVLAFINEFKLTAKPQATGSPPATLTAVMTGQVDVGWAAPPFGLKEMDEGKINLVAKATDAKIVAGQTIRVIAVNAETSPRSATRSCATCRPIARPSTTCIRATRRSRTMPSSPRSTRRWRGACAISSSRRPSCSRTRLRASTR